ncbi:MAG: methyltransferase domain-containing protein [Planctomycetota bacterium]
MNIASNNQPILCTIFIPSRRTNHFSYMDILGPLPLLEHSIKCALNCSLLDDILVISNAPEFESLCNKHNINICYYSAKCENDKFDFEVEQIKAGVVWLEENLQKKYKTIINLSPDTPLRTASDIYDALKLFTESRSETLRSVLPKTSTGNSPLPGNGHVYDQEIQLLGAQSPERRNDSIYLHNHCIDVWFSKYLFGMNKSGNAKPTLYIMPEYRGWVIKNRFDFLVAESIYQNWTKFYFNSGYCEYWKKRTSQDNKEVDKTATESKFRLFFNHAIKEVESGARKILDLGCGFGRFFPMFLENGLDIYGIDISQDMINKAFHAYRNKVKELKVGQLESIEYQDNFFDVVITWAVFDATRQEKVIREILRTLKTGGVAVVTGKNDNYFADDEQAIIAEEMARRKRHPNHFTNYDRMKSYVQSLGGTFVGEYFFLRRGDFGNNVYLAEQPAKFYEWCVLIKKAAPLCTGKNEEELYSDFSRTFESQKREIPSKVKCSN